jgi:hypothetical protein
MRVLVACEFSGVVRDAFTARGHDAMSCDLLPTESPGPHYEGDVRDILGDGWDLMVAHPPCTYLCRAGTRWLYEKPGRWEQMADGAVFFLELLNAPIARLAVENPIMHSHARQIVGRRADQVIQPWQFGHLESKATGLWLRGLPPLIATEDGRAAMESLPRRESRKVHYAAPSADRWKLRSATYPGIAAAMAEQWGSVDARLSAGGAA